MKERLDIRMVQSGLAQSREKAKVLIKGGQVFVDGVRQTKAATTVEENAQVEVRGETLQYVSRGGLKLEKAMDTFALNLQGCVCMDIGASTGGFTDCMLQNGAVKVYAVDVGHDQLAESLRADARVVNLEGTNIRYLTLEQLGQRPQFVSIDVSFISLTKVLEPVFSLLEDGGQIAALIKPQFEAGRENVGKKGVVRDRKIHVSVLRGVLSHAVEIGYEIQNLTYSPIKGPEGNIEYLVHLKKETSGGAGVLLDQIQTVVTQAHESLRNVEE